MARSKVSKVLPKSAKKAATTRVVRRKPAELTPEKRAELVKAATRLAIEMHRDALKELERY